MKINRKTKLIETYRVSDASVHDSQVLFDLLDESDGELCADSADSAYKSAEIDRELKRRRIRSRVHEKGNRNTPLTREQKS